MLLKDFMESPPLKGAYSIRIPTNEIIYEHRKTYKLLKRKITSKKYRDKDGVYVIVKIPSSSVKDFYYDVVFQFTEMGDSLENSHVKVFSNSPSFVYNFAYVFYHYTDKNTKSLIIDKFKQKIPQDNLTLHNLAQNKLGKEVLTIPPEIRNPHGFPIMDKSLYLAAFHILDNYTAKNIIFGARFITPAQLENWVMSFEKTMLLRTKMIHEMKSKILDNLNIRKDEKQILKKAIDKGLNVNIRYTKKHGIKTRVSASRAVNNLNKKAGSMRMNVIKKMK